MSVYKLIREDGLEALRLFNKVIASDGLLYKALDEELFVDLFLTETETVKKLNLGFGSDGWTVGFINGSYRLDTEEAYLTFLAVDKPYRRRGIGKILVNSLHERLRNMYPGIKSIEIRFQNPIQLECAVPGTIGVLHNNSPGIDISTSAYILLKNMGYRDIDYQNSYYAALGAFGWSDDVAEKLEALKARNINVCFYDEFKHFGFDKLCDDLESEDLRQQIFENLEKEKPDPMLVVEHSGKICGFAGPLCIEENGRGCFADVGVHSQYLGIGVGTTLFAALCMALKEMDAGYMTLFTEESNPARNIYEDAGFKIVKTWANMRKEFDGNTYE